MDVVISTARLPPAERFPHLREMALRLPDPVEFRSPGRPDFPAKTPFRTIGEVTVTCFTTTGPAATEVLRTPEPIRRSDPGHHRFPTGRGIRSR